MIKIKNPNQNYNSLLKDLVLTKSNNQFKTKIFIIQIKITFKMWKNIKTYSVIIPKNFKPKLMKNKINK